VRGRLPEALTPRGQPQRRCDEYDLRRLAPHRAVKRRGRRHLEWKQRIGRVELIEIANVTGFAERWMKGRALDDQRNEPGEWLAVHKRIWRGRGVEVSAVEVAGEEWWSLAVSCDGMVEHVLEPWWCALRADGEASAYPGWLLTLARSARLLAAA